MIYFISGGWDYSSMLVYISQNTDKYKNLTINKYMKKIFIIILVVLCILFNILFFEFVCDNVFYIWIIDFFMSLILVLCLKNIKIITNNHIYNAWEQFVMGHNDNSSYYLTNYLSYILKQEVNEPIFVFFLFRLYDDELQLDILKKNTIHFEIKKLLLKNTKSKYVKYSYVLT